MSEGLAVPPVAEAVTVVSGLPRSGTSMMMRMLAAGGMPVVADNIRQANEDNPHGYYELEKIKQLKTDNTWLVHEKGRVVKAVSVHLPLLPENIFYYVIFMQRDMGEILASQRKMLERRGTVAESDVPDEVMAAKYESYLEATFRWLARKNNFHVLPVHYGETIRHPLEAARRVETFLATGLDVEKMAQMVDPDLYRQRRP